MTVDFKIVDDARAPAGAGHLVHVTDLIQAYPGLGKALAQQSGARARLRRVRALLPAAMREHCTDTGLEGTVLTLTLDAAVWAAQARFLAPALVTGLSDPEVQAIRVRVRPPALVPEPAAAVPPRRLSARVAAHLLEFSRNLADPELAAAFRRLALRHGGDGG